MENSPRSNGEGAQERSQLDAEMDPVAADPNGFNVRVSQLRETERERGDDAALSVAFGEAVVTVDLEAEKPEPSKD